ncbi:MAG: hypothetical protein LUD15_08600 [Bacteroides sp.]|nr:hypothetical protein [Bacteroides sp.]
MQEETQASFAEVKDDLENLRSDVDTNTRRITELEEEVDNAELFKGYFATTAEITDLQGTRGAFAWNGQSGTVWVYNADLLTWQDSFQPIPTEGSATYNQEPKMDGTASAGTSSEYARGNHVHPTDSSRAAASDLEAVSERVKAVEEKAAGTESAISGISRDIISLEEKVDSSV